MIEIKYIGPDRCYGLTSGEVYGVDLFAKNSLIWVKVEGRTAAIPYASPLAFSNNWTTV